MTITVKQNSKECFYEMLDKDESVTASLFILSGAELKGGLLLEGPVAGPDAASGTELHNMATQLEQSKVTMDAYSKIEEDVNFEHLLPEAPEEPEQDDDAIMWGQKMDDDSLTEEEIQKRLQERKKHIQLARQRAREARRRKIERMKANNIVREGEPVQRTLVAKGKGWYRACVKGNWYQITAELEMRKESDLGGIDPDTGHVFSYAKKEEKSEADFLEKDSASKEEGMKDEDFATVKSQLQKLRRLLSEIQQRQATERHRLVVHAASNEHSHSRMVLTSLFETVLFMLVTGFQVYTIRKWFSGHGSILAR
jgi:hypothetical protein